MLPCRFWIAIDMNFQKMYGFEGVGLSKTATFNLWAKCRGSGWWVGGPDKRTSWSDLEGVRQRDRFPVEKVQTRIMSPASVRLGQPGKHQIVSKSGNLEIFFWILRQFGDVLKMLEMFWRCLGCALQEYFASGSGNVRNFRMQQVSSYETRLQYITTQHTWCFYWSSSF